MNVSEGALTTISHTNILKVQSVVWECKEQRDRDRRMDGVDLLLPAEMLRCVQGLLSCLLGRLNGVLSVK